MEWKTLVNYLLRTLITFFNHFFDKFTIELMKTHNISLLAKYQIDRRLITILYIKYSKFLKLYRKQELIHQSNKNIVIDSLNIIKDNHLLYSVH